MRTTTSARGSRAERSSCAPRKVPHSPRKRTSSPAIRCFTGATAGEVYINGQVGERFCVRNSGAVAVVEGVGDHGCEQYDRRPRCNPRADRPQLRGRDEWYCGGIAYVWDRDGNFDFFCNMEMVELTLAGRRSGRHTRTAQPHHGTSSPYRKPVGAAHTRQLEHIRGPVHQGHADRIQKSIARRADRATQFQNRPCRTGLLA